MSKYVLGLDGGATKSHLVLIDSSGKCVGKSTYGCLNHDLMKGSYEELKEHLGKFIPPALKEMNISIDEIKYSVFGMAGVDTAQQQVLISDMMRSIGFENFLVCNDAFLGIAAGCPECSGICAINGTGYKVAAIDYSGAEVHICGFGEYTDDRGGGIWYGAHAIGAAYNELFRLGTPTIMRNMLFEAVGVTNKEDFHEVIINSSQDGSLLNNLAVNSVVFEAAARGDAVALGIIKESALQYADAIAHLALELDFPADRTLHVVLLGSVFVKQKVKLLQEFISERISDRLGARSVDYICLEFAPVAGALMLAAQRAGFSIDKSVIEDAIAGLVTVGS